MLISISGKLAEVTRQNSMTQRKRRSQWRKFHQAVNLGTYRLCTVWINNIFSKTGVQQCHRDSVQSIRWKGRVILPSDHILHHCLIKLTLGEQKSLMLVCVNAHSCIWKVFYLKHHSVCKSTVLTLFSLLRRHPWYRGSALDSWPTGLAIDPTPGAWFLTEFISFAQVVSCPL